MNTSSSQATQMRPDSEIPDNFEELLAWLNSDRELAGRLYEEIRRELIKIFGWNRCADPEGMADESFDRAARKAKHLRETFEGNPKLFFYGIAGNLIKEYQKTIKLRVSIDDVDVSAFVAEESEDHETQEMIDACLQRCLHKLADDKRDLILTYYANEKQAKIDERRRMAERLGFSIQTLRVRMHRLRTTLEECIEDCLKAGKKDETK